MAASTNVSNLPRRGLSTRTFNIVVIGLVLLMIGVFIYSYFMGYNLLKSLKNSKLNLGNPSPPTFVMSLYGEGAQGQLKKPMAVTVADGLIYISDTGNQRIQIYNSNGSYVSSFGQKGVNKGEFQFPYGIAVDDLNNVYVADLNAGTVQVFNPEGEFQRYFPEDKRENGSFKAPAGLFYRDSKLFVTDVATNTVKVFNTTSGEKVLEFGKSGNGLGEFSAPNAVTATKDAIYVSDSFNESVQAFSPDGQFMYKMDGTKDGKNPKTLTARGVGVDGRGVLYTVSMMGNYITGFNNKGEFLWTFGTQGSEDNQFYLPNGLFVDNQGRIYITDQGNNKVSVWEN